MKKFKWRLQRVLDIKQKEEQLKKIELTEITSRLSITKGQLMMQKRILKNMIDDLGTQNPKDRLAGQALFMKRSEVNDKVIKELSQKANELGAKQKEKVAEVLKVRQFKEGLEKLRAKNLEAFIKRQKKIEQKAVDDMTTYKFAQKAMQLMK